MIRLQTYHGLEARAAMDSRDSGISRNYESPEPKIPGMNKFLNSILDIYYFRLEAKLMQIDFSDYSKLVTAAFYKKLANRELPRFVSQTTPAKLKRECIEVFQHRHLKKDERVLSNFFGELKEDQSFISSIKRTDREKFKPLNNYLKKSTEKTDDKNIELLAWLIDFPYRPYSIGMNVVLSEEELFLIRGNEKQREEPIDKAVVSISVIENLPTAFEATIEEGGSNEIDQEQSTHKKTIPPAPFNSSFLKKKNIFVFSLLLAGFSGVFYFFNQQNKNGCMYWNNDHYEKVACNELPKGRFIVPQNESIGLRRITKPDTISEKSIGKVYYIKDTNKIYYFTQGGNYPLDPKRSLKKLSSYIFNKYKLRQTISSAPK